MHFDARAAKLLKPGEHLIVDGCPGLRLEVSITRKTWTYRYRNAGGKLRQVSLGQWPLVPVQSVVVKWQEARDLRESGVDPKQTRAEAKKPTPEAYAVKDLVQDYLAGHIEGHRKPAGALAVRRSFERLLVDEPDFANLAAADLRRAAAFEILDRRKGTPTAAAKLRSLLGAAWDYAIESGKLDDRVPNHWPVVMKGRLKSKGKTLEGVHVGARRRVLSAAEVGTLVRWLPNMHALGRDALVMYLWTCTRGVEILAMRPEHVGQEADGWWWTVPKELTKNSRYVDAVALRVPLLGRALEVVQRRVNGIGASSLLFEDARGEQYEQKDFSTYIYSLQPYSEKAKRREGRGLECPVTDWTPHNLRRTSRTLLASIGCPDEVAEALLGHLPEGVRGIYNAFTYDKERRLWLTKLDQLLETLAGLPALP